MTQLKDQLDQTHKMPELDGQTARPPADDESSLEYCYPGDLCRAELKELQMRRQAILPGPVSPKTKQKDNCIIDPVKDSQLPADTVGVALSGGGIRSATFCLGFFQGLARCGLIREIDYLSTVSGGGYFGGFLGRLFTRLNPGYPLSPGSPPPVDEIEKTLADNLSPPLKFLRDNGRYLSPSGSGDNLIAAAIYLRNLVSIHLVIGLFFLGAFFLLNFIRFTGVFGGFDKLPAPDALIWWSPYWIVSLVVVVMIAIPFGWAYWIGQIRSNQCWSWRPLIGTLTWIAGAVGLKVLCHQTLGISFTQSGWKIQWPDLVTSLAVYWPGAALFLIWPALQVLAVRWTSREMGKGKADEAGMLAQTAWVRQKVSSILMMSLMVAAVIACLAMTDSIGQTLYLKLKSHELDKLISGYTSLPIVGVLTGLLTFLKQIVNKLDMSKPAGKTKLPLTITMYTGAVSIAAILLIGLCTLAHLLTRNWGLPLAIEPAAQVMRISLIGFLLTVLVCRVLGPMPQFLNLSSFHTVYAARLIRAYLGASNPMRIGPEDGELAPDVSSVRLGDNLNWKLYRPHQAGGPLHLVNVTFNETVEGRSKIEYRDRKGLPMAVGPCGLSVGVRHHALWAEPDSGTRMKGNLAYIKPIGRTDLFHAFQDESGGGHWVENLDLGSWIAASGAAVSPGMGWRTNLGASLLLGLANIRLGYWWDSRIQRPWRRPHTQRTRGIKSLERSLTRLFASQSYLLDELLGRFHGPGSQLWYLSDGGCFENTGCFELIRRRVPLIICCDCGQDQDYTFKDIADLVRRARVDFNAEIHFITSSEGLSSAAKVLDRTEWGRVIKQGWHDGKIGPLPQLVSRKPDGTVGEKATSHAGNHDDAVHASLALVHYPDNPPDEPGSVIVFVKPGLTGDEPEDIRSYQSGHRTFPQESTADQNFDEAQWESYRELGEHIAQTLFPLKKDNSDSINLKNELVQQRGAEIIE